ncbi:MAG: triose-phosphate isomerase [Paracoccaceae bacterium]
MRRKLAAGNWKMNGTASALTELSALVRAHSAAQCDLLICPPATLLSRAAHQTEGSAIAIGGQDCHCEGSGAHTGDVSAEMLKDAGASAAILGHSERRAEHGETDSFVRAKVVSVLNAGMQAVVCLGESLTERESGQTLQVVGTQLAGSLPDTIDPDRLVVAYEPIWAIGTGKVPTLDQIAEVHDFLRAELIARFGQEGDKIPLLYGGSVKPNNAAEIFAVENVDGALVGGASLKAEDFSPIISALEAS